jgi:hypothetical protein
MQLQYVYNNYNMAFNKYATECHFMTFYFSLNAMLK